MQALQLVLQFTFLNTRYSNGSPIKGIHAGCSKSSHDCLWYHSLVPSLGKDFAEVINCHHPSWMRRHVLFSSIMAMTF